MRLRQHAELESEIPKFVWRNEKMPIDRSMKEEGLSLSAAMIRYTRLKPGDKGTYEFANITGEGRDRMVQHNIKWDSGYTLMLIRRARLVQVHSAWEIKWQTNCPNS